MDRDFRDGYTGHMCDRYLHSPIPPPLKRLSPQAWDLWDAKAKPQFSLGVLEHLAVDIVCMRGELQPELSRPLLLLFAGDHGVVEEGVTASPREITWQQCENFSSGGGAIGLMCAGNGIDLRVIDVGVAHDFGSNRSVLNRKIAWGTRNLAREAAMDRSQCLAAMDTGRDLVAEAAASGRNVIAFGEMGVGNTTSASALTACLTHCGVELCTGRGSGLDRMRLEHKRTVVSRSLVLHGNPPDPVEVLRRYGGLEIAAIVGGLLEAASRRMVILMDGFITTSALLVAKTINPAVTDYVIYCHESGEPGHRVLLEHMGGKPLLHLSMSLGEGTGAALGWLVVRQAMDLYRNMTSFSSAGVTDSVSLLKEQGVDPRG